MLVHKPIGVSVIEIQGIEITQAIRYYKSSQHLTNPQNNCRIILLHWLPASPPG